MWEHLAQLCSQGWERARFKPFNHKWSVWSANQEEDNEAALEKWPSSQRDRDRSALWRLVFLLLRRNLFLWQGSPAGYFCIGISSPRSCLKHSPDIYSIQGYSACNKRKTIEFRNPEWHLWQKVWKVPAGRPPEGRFTLSLPLKTWASLDKSFLPQFLSLQNGIKKVLSCS